MVGDVISFDDVIGYQQSWAPATWKVAALLLPLFGKKSSGAAAYRYLNKKVAPLPLLEKINSKKTINFFNWLSNVKNLQIVLNTCKMWSNGIKLAFFFQTITKNSPSVEGFAPRPT